MNEVPERAHPRRQPSLAGLISRMCASTRSGAVKESGFWSRSWIVVSGRDSSPLRYRTAFFARSQGCAAHATGSGRCVYRRLGGAFVQGIWCRPNRCSTMIALFGFSDRGGPLSSGGRMALACLGLAASPCASHSVESFVPRGLIQGGRSTRS